MHVKKTNFKRLLALKTTKGFTIVELIVVIVIIGILSTITVISYGGYQKTVAITQLKADLTAASAAMLKARSYNETGYPTDVNSISTLKVSQSVTLSGGSNDGGETYCIDAVNSKYSDINYFIDSLNSSPSIKEGTCASAYPAPSNLVAVAASSSIINLSWNSVSGVTKYTVQLSTVASFVGATTLPIQTGTTAESSGLLSATTYYYRVAANTPAGVSGWSNVASATTQSMAAPSTPVLVVDMEGNNVRATITALTCTAGTVQYAVRSRVNDGTWSSYSAWAITTVYYKMVPDTEGVKYSYQAQARCYSSDTVTSAIVTSVESVYIYPIYAPAAPTVAANTVSSMTTWSWPASTCGAGTASYQYRYTISPSGYDSGWVTNGTNLSIAFTTSTIGQTYSVAVQTKCSNAYTTSAWSVSGNAVYFNSPGSLVALSVPTIATGSSPQDIVISADGMSVYAVNKDANTVSMYGRNASTGNLTALSTPTIATGSNPLSLAISADGTSVYVSNFISSTISMYKRNVITGILSSVGTVATGTYPLGVVISTDGTSAYTVNKGSNTISIYSRNTDTGVLTSYSTFAIAAGANNYYITISADGKSVYVANFSQSTVSMFSRNTSTGALSAFGMVASGSYPNRTAISADGISAYVVNSGSVNTVSMYSRNTSTGALTSLSTPTVITGSNPQNVVISADGLSAYVVNSGSNTISMYSRNTSTGVLVALDVPTITTGSSPLSVAISADGSSVYAVNSGSNTISMYSRAH